MAVGADALDLLDLALDLEAQALRESRDLAFDPFGIDFRGAPAFDAGEHDAVVIVGVIEMVAGRINLAALDLHVP